jgi:hypothetical protein
MDTTTMSKNAAKKRRQRENRAATSSQTPATTPDTSPPAIIVPNTSDATTAATDTSEYPDKEIEDLWRLVARRAAKQAWQDNYAREQRLIAACAPPLWDSWSDVRQAAENYHLKQLHRTAPIAVHAFVEPPTIANLTPALIPTTCIDTAPEDCETVEQIDAKLLRMQEQWAQSRSGPFPESILNVIAYLRSELEQQAPPSAPAPAHSPNSSPITTFESDTATPAQTSSQAPTTTTDSSAAASTEKTMVAMTAAVKLHETTQDDSEEHEGSEETRRDEIGEGEIARRERAKEGENEKGEVASKGIEERRGEVRGNLPPPEAHNAHSATTHEPVRIDWATDIDQSIGPVPSPSDFRPTTPANHNREATTNSITSDTAPGVNESRSPASLIKPSANGCPQGSSKPPSPLASPIPAHRPLANPATPPQLVREPPKPAVTPQNSDVAPCARTPATGASNEHTPAAPTDCTPAAHSPNAPALVNPVPSDVTIDPVPEPAAFAKPDQIVPASTIPPIVHGPRDFSALHSGTQNPWGSIHSRRYRSHPAPTYRRHSGPGPPQYPHSHPPHPRHLNSRPRHSFNAQPHRIFDTRQPEPHQLNPNSNFHRPAKPQPPAHNFQIIQHPLGISDSKPKIIKNIPAPPILSAETQEHTHVSHCACGAILPFRRSRRWRFGRRFHRRIWDHAYGHSYLGWSRPFSLVTRTSPFGGG